MLETKVNYKEDFLLSPHWELCRRAHLNTSFSPEKRADMYVKDYSEQLQEDLEKLGDNQGNYKEKYIRYFTTWMSAKSNCLSSMITGPARFPTRRAEKANNTEHRRWEEFENWRNKYFNAVNRQRTLSPEEDLELLYKRLDDYIITNEIVKECNKILKQYKTGKITKDAMFEKVKEAGLKDKNILRIQSFIDEAWFQKLATLGPDIKRQKERIEELKSRIETKASWQDIIFEGGYITVEDDRVKVFHDEKPNQEIINNLKRHGFKWSRFWKCWCRKHTKQAVYDAQRICA